MRLLDILIIGQKIIGNIVLLIAWNPMLTSMKPCCFERIAENERWKHESREVE
jgi:hypothetical protein